MQVNFLLLGNFKLWLNQQKSSRELSTQMPPIEGAFKCFEMRNYVRSQVEVVESTLHEGSKTLQFSTLQKKFKKFDGSRDPYDNLEQYRQLLFAK